MSSGKMIRTLREMRGLSQKTLAEQIGWNQEDVSRIETGRVQITVEKLRQAAAFFDVLSSVILGEIPLANTKLGAGPVDIDPVIWNIIEVIWDHPGSGLVSAEDIEPHLHMVCRNTRAANISSKKQRLVFIKYQINTVVETLETLHKMTTGPNLGKSGSKGK
jgi:transcriptional regulator with XRE-family HTH domain